MIFFMVSFVCSAWLAPKSFCVYQLRSDFASAHADNLPLVFGGWVCWWGWLGEGSLQVQIEEWQACEYTTGRITMYLPSKEVVHGLCCVCVCVKLTVWPPMRGWEWSWNLQNLGLCQALGGGGWPSPAPLRSPARALCCSEKNPYKINPMP